MLINRIVFRHFLLLFMLFGITNLSFATEYELINWVDLLPEKDLKALESPPEYLNEIEDGSVEDSISSQVLNALEQSIMSPNTQSPYEAALVSTDVVEAMNGKSIRLPGFIVPITINEKQEVSEFFLVPFFGACIHFPPPPPNQIIYVKTEKSILIEDIYEAYWVEGVISTTLTDKDIALSAYSMTAQHVEIYTEE